MAAKYRDEITVGQSRFMVNFDYFR